MVDSTVAGSLLTLEGGHSFGSIRDSSNHKKWLSKGEASCALGQIVRNTYNFYRTWENMNIWSSYMKGQFEKEKILKGIILFW